MCSKYLGCQILNIFFLLGCTQPTHLEIAQNEPDRVKVVDAKKSIDQVHMEVIKLVEDVLLNN